MSFETTASDYEPLTGDTQIEESNENNMIDESPPETPVNEAMRQVFSAVDITKLPIETKHPPRMNYNITLDNCLLLKVNRHINGFDGTICPNAVRVLCGAPEYFRQMYCEKGESRCYDLGLFGKDEYKVWKPADDEYSEFLSTIAPGNIMLFWTNRGIFNYLVGVYVVDKVERRDSRDGMLLGRPHYLITGRQDLSVRFTDSLIDSTPIWNRSVRSETFSKYVRKIDRSAIIPFLQRIQEQHELKSSEMRTAGRISDAEHCDITVDRLIKIIDLVGEGNDTNRHKSTAGNGSSKPILQVAPPPAQRLNKAVAVEVERVIKFLREEKLYYPDELIWRYHISLISKPFVILTGVSGGGKTRLTEVYAHAMNGKYCLVSIRPDWQSNESLLGSYDILNKRFIPTEFCRHVSNAAIEWRRNGKNARKYFVCLDEMNLARAEYYFSDFLSRLEVEGDLRKIRLYDQPQGSDDDIEQDLYIPPNLCITGTVNLDETTHTFSRKVLDRANIIKIDRIEIGHMLDLLRSDYDEVLLDFVGTHLKEINLRLAEAGQQFGYRTVHEILDWVNEAYQSGYFTMPAALDIQAVQKILVKLEVSSDHNRQTSMLEKLNTYFDQETRNAETDRPLFERSSEMVNELIARLQEEEIVIGQL